jgi:transcriptional regulator with XRE-family HTH domain
MQFYRLWISSEIERRKSEGQVSSLRQFSKSIGVSSSLISRICTGSLMPGIKTAAKIVARTKMRESDKEKFVASIIREIEEEFVKLISEEVEREKKKENTSLTRLSTTSEVVQTSNI